jgi:outer membrane protein assembly factor BamB
VDEETGQQKWKFNTNGPMASSPAVANGMVYVKAYNKAFYALAADTGAVRWTFLTEYERRFEAKGLHGYTTRLQTIPDSWDIFLSSPAVSGGKVIFGSGDGNVYALDALTGVLQWKFETSDVVHASPAIANNTVYIGSWDSNLYALDADTGQEKWRFKAGEDPVIHNQVGFQSSTAIVGGTLYVGCRDGHVYAIDAATGRKKWDYPTNMGWVPGTPAVRDGVVYVGLSDGARFYALDAKTGRTRYTLSAKANVFSSPALAGDLGYFGVMNGRLEAFDTKTGKIAWEFQTESSKKDALKLLNADGSFNLDTVYGPYFHDYQDMALAIYRVFSLGAIVSSPVIDRGTVYFGSTDGNLYAIH